MAMVGCKLCVCIPGKRASNVIVWKLHLSDSLIFSCVFHGNEPPHNVALNSCETEAWYLLFSNRLSRKSNTLIFQVVRFIEATRGFLLRLYVSDVMLVKKKCQISYVVRSGRTGSYGIVDRVYF